MNLDLPRLLLVVALAAAGVVLLLRAINGGGPLYYFFSAVCFGMAFAAFQGGGAGAANTRRGQGGTGHGRPKNGRRR